MSQHVVTFEPDGTVRYLEKHEDSLDLRGLGEHTIERATDITYNQDTQKWDVVLCGRETEHHPMASMGFPSYEIARQFEVEWLQLCATRREDPLTMAGAFSAGRARRRVDNRHK